MPRVATSFAVVATCSCWRMFKSSRAGEVMSQDSDFEDHRVLCGGSKSSVHAAASVGTPKAKCQLEYADTSPSTKMMMSQENIDGTITLHDSFTCSIVFDLQGPQNGKCPA